MVGWCCAPGSRWTARRRITGNWIEAQSGPRARSLPSPLWGGSTRGARRGGGRMGGGGGGRGGVLFPPRLGGGRGGGGGSGVGVGVCRDDHAPMIDPDP